MTFNRLDIRGSTREFGSVPVFDPVSAAAAARELERERKQARVDELRRRLRKHVRVNTPVAYVVLVLLGIIGPLLVMAAPAADKGVEASVFILAAMGIAAARRADIGIEQNDFRWFVISLASLAALLAEGGRMGAFPGVVAIYLFFAFRAVRDWLDLLTEREEEPERRARAVRRRHLVVRRLLPASGLVLGLLWTEEWWTRPRPIGVEGGGDCGGRLYGATITSESPIGGTRRPHAVVLWRGTTSVAISQAERTRANELFMARWYALLHARLDVVGPSDAEIIHRWDGRREVSIAGRTFAIPHGFDVLVIMLDARGTPPHWEFAGTVTIPSRGLRDAGRDLKVIAARSPVAASFIASALR